MWANYSNFIVWGVLAFVLVFVGAYALWKPHKHDSTPPKDR
jgi:hypothetical protein